ncbi:Bax inhibitor-1/YccA family protein [Quadrisphaera sp. INWT6]|uniref:Bax inhibitor-1/YccA family protein n=1 Tax=Quadrisphaera sp. INWT6 TaxID=2596917 RepID=UPI00189247E1|nr:Bax inhibitor-1/YccA family protein [Quadrisphaera sp. INWT6]MBF5080410.1 Bax inhibitor-1/YccA family protein [Quadrisphaera sp. INWT6]
MESNNPALRNAPQFKRGGYAGFDAAPRGGAPTAPHDARSLEDMYNGPTATASHTGRMTYDDVVLRAGMTLGTVVVLGGVSYLLGNPLLMIVGALGGLVLGLVNSFKREPSPALILAYAALQGLFIGGISKFIDVQYAGSSVALQAVIATVAVFAVMLVLYRSGAVRATPKFRRILIGAVLGYAVFCLINFVFALFGAGLNLWAGPLGLAVGAIGAVLASLSLVLDFDFIETGVKNGIPQRYAWTAAFGLTVTLVWLYIELLRILSILRSMAGGD